MPKYNFECDCVVEDDHVVLCQYHLEFMPTTIEGIIRKINLAGKQTEHARKFREEGGFNKVHGKLEQKLVKWIRETPIDTTPHPDHNKRPPKPPRPPKWDGKNVRKP